MTSPARRVSLLVAIAAVGLGAMAAGPVGAKPEKGGKPGKPVNPLAGKWVGQTAAKPGMSYPGPYAPLSFRITKGGRVLDLATSVTTDKTAQGGTCPTPVFVTVAMPPAQLSGESDFFTEGKRFRFEGTNAGSPSARLYGSGKVAPPYGAARDMEGFLIVGGSGTIVVSPGVVCRTGTVYWSARRVGR